MDDLISRQAAIDVLDAFAVKIENGEPFAYSWSRMRMTELPSVEPEIIRCKDCKHRIEHKNYGDLGESAYTCEGNMGGWILSDGFCSYAERRTDDTQKE